MKLKHLLFYFVMLVLTDATAIAQDATNMHLSAKDNTPFGKKLPPPDVIEYAGKSLPQMMRSRKNFPLMPGTHHPDINAIKKNLEDYRQQKRKGGNAETKPFQENVTNGLERPNRSHNSRFHLTKDINALAESNPANFSAWIINPSYAILNQTMYFAADDGIHGNELWRSDGTDAGTFMVKDAEPGFASSDPIEITEANGKIYYSATTSAYGQEPWVSDGTESGTQLLMDIDAGTVSSAPGEFAAMGTKVYFASSVNDFMDALYETDGTTAGTNLVKDLAIDPGGFLISQLIQANGLLYFTFISYTTGAYELWRSDGTDAGTYHVGTNAFFYNNFPLQLTSYNNKLYFSADDGTGNKLWVTDGTDAGTTLAPGNNDILITQDNNFGPTFPVINKVLYISGSSLTTGGGLYKYDASNTAGVVLVKDLAADADFILPPEMKVVNNTLYFKVTGNNGGLHDEIWSSKGTEDSTYLINKFLPDETINHLYSANNTLYFVKHDKFLGSELWKVLNTFFGTFPLPVDNIFRGAAGSYPDYLTAFKGKLFFSAADEKKGNELFKTNDWDYGTSLVKDINIVSTSNSYAGFYVRALTPFGNNVLFSAFERAQGYELYKSDGTEDGTVLLNDILPGETGSFGSASLFPIGNMMSKNNNVYFIAQSSDTTYSIFKTNGTKSGLQKVVPDYRMYPQYFIQDFNVADNNNVFYVLFNYATFTNELWRSSGTTTGNVLLSSTLASGYNLNVVGNTAFFVAGDATNGYELWKSDGSVTGTGLVKDINPGAGNSNPAGMFIYKKEVYFAANNGAGPSFWKSNGTSTGTIQLANIDPWYSSVLATALYHFEVSNNILYFAAVDSKGAELYRTDGTIKGTYAVKDISPNVTSDSPFPFYFTDVNGTLFFIGDDGVNGAELWKTDGTEKGTQLVKDITPGADPSTLANLISFGGKLFFTNSGLLWSSDGIAEGTLPVDDEVISKVNVKNIVATPDNLFLSGYTYRYGYELYAGKVNGQTDRLEVTKSTDKSAQTNLAFNAALYPNPAVSNVTLQVTGDIKNDVSVSISDISGKKLWQANNSINAKVRLLNLPTDKYEPGIYFVTITSGTDSKTINLVKQ